MPLVPAKCTQCGGNLEVDSALEEVICPRCKTPFITERTFMVMKLQKILKNNLLCL